MPSRRSRSPAYSPTDQRRDSVGRYRDRSRERPSRESRERVSSRSREPLPTSRPRSSSSGLRAEDASLGRRSPLRRRWEDGDGATARFASGHDWRRDRYNFRRSSSGTRYDTGNGHRHHNRARGSHRDSPPRRFSRSPARSRSRERRTRAYNTRDDGHDGGHRRYNGGRFNTHRAYSNGDHNRGVHRHGNSFSRAPHMSPRISNSGGGVLGNSGPSGFVERNGPGDRSNGRSAAIDMPSPRHAHSSLRSARRGQRSPHGSSLAHSGGNSSSSIGSSSGLAESRGSGLSVIDRFSDAHHGGGGQRSRSSSIGRVHPAIGLSTQLHEHRSSGGGSGSEASVVHAYGAEYGGGDLTHSRGSDSYDRLLAQQLSLLATGGSSAPHGRNNSSGGEHDDDDRGNFDGNLSASSSVAGDVGGDGPGIPSGGGGGGSGGGGGLHLRTEHLTALGGSSLPLTSLTSLSAGLNSSRGRRRSHRKSHGLGSGDELLRHDGGDCDLDGSSSVRGLTEPSSGYLTEGTAGTLEEDREEDDHSHSHLFDGLSERDASNGGHDDRRDRDRDRMMNEETASIDAHPPLSEKAGSVYGGGGGSVAGSVYGAWSRAGSVAGDDVSVVGDDASLIGAPGQRSPDSSSNSALHSPPPSPTCSSSSSASAFSLRFAPNT